MGAMLEGAASRSLHRPRAEDAVYRNANFWDCLAFAQIRGYLFCVLAPIISKLSENREVSSILPAAVVHKEQEERMP